ncbi:hypothetical protein WN55_01493 [Dufourea novaeangliae]|uniref:Uncharacterized protein n=1 Tax=Dufourea novaeangliae TaxID=178035 RepID=A0A154PEZ4_DUFNO|nr:hypothetical protein WN55_01493 [Dufourea novaeangliae]
MTLIRSGTVYTARNSVSIWSDVVVGRNDDDDAAGGWSASLSTKRRVSKGQQRHGPLAWPVLPIPVAAPAQPDTAGQSRWRRRRSSLLVSSSRGASCILARVVCGAPALSLVLAGIEDGSPLALSRSLSLSFSLSLTHTPTLSLSPPAPCALLLDSLSP